jgi:hypothetical protein
VPCTIISLQSCHPLYNVLIVVTQHSKRLAQRLTKAPKKCFSRANGRQCFSPSRVCTSRTGTTVVTVASDLLSVRNSLIVNISYGSCPEHEKILINFSHTLKAEQRSKVLSKLDTGTESGGLPSAHTIAKK